MTMLRHYPKSLFALLLLPLSSACTVAGGVENQGTFRVTITAVDGAPLPTADSPLPANTGETLERWSFVAEVHDASGALDASFEGMARVDLVPGSIEGLEGATAVGRNIRFVGGRAEGVALVTAMFGPTRLWVEDVGYVPAAPGETPACSNGIDDDGDVVNDFPNDPGCAFADDMTEESGTLLTGVSQPVQYALPTIAEVQGMGSTSPYENVAVEIEAHLPAELIVTRVSSSGFFVTDLGGTATGYNHLYAFNFNTPPGMRVCHRLSFLSGTASEFFGFTEVSFPSWEVGHVTTGATVRCQRDKDCVPGEFCERLTEYAAEGLCQPCIVPQPPLLQNTTLTNSVEMEKLESGLVRMAQVVITPNFGPERPTDLGGGNFAFGPSASNCDLNGDGTIDYFDDDENACSNQCADDPECSEWLGFASRGNYKVHKSAAMIQVNTGTAQGFNPVEHKGEQIAYVTGTLRNFSGGSLNWTIETRCSEDLVCNFDEVCAPLQGCEGACSTDPDPQTCLAACNPALDAARSCITPATESDNEAGTN